MKNRKIVALLCAMVMIMTTLSSIITVNAEAAAPKLSMAIGECVDGKYPVTINYSGFEGKLSVIDIAIPVPDGVSVVDGLVIKNDEAFGAKATATAGYNKRLNQVVVGGTQIDGETMNASSGVLATFELKLNDDVKQNIKLEFSKEDTTITDETSGTAVDFKIDDSDNPITVKNATLVYQKPYVPGTPKITLEKTYVSKNEYKITIYYDVSDLLTDDHKIELIDISIPVPDGVSVVDGLVIKNDDAFGADATATAGYNKRLNQVVVGGTQIDGDLFAKPSGVLATFKVTITDDAIFAPSDIEIKPLDGEKLYIDDVYYNTIIFDIDAEPPVVTDTPTPTPEIPGSTPTPTPEIPGSTPTPTPEIPGSTPTPTPSVTETPSAATPAPVQIDVKPYTNSSLIGKDKAGVSVTLKSINLEEVKTEKVDIVIQGFTKAPEKGGISCGNVIIAEIDITKPALLDIPFNGYVAGAKYFAVNVYDHKDPNRVLADRKDFTN